MPSESDRPIEKQLREYATNRRASADKDAFALHPVTRNVLQVEVEREFGRRARERRAGLGWFDWAPQLIWGGAVVAVLVLVFTVVWWPAGSKNEVGDLASVTDAETNQLPEPIIDTPPESQQLAKAEATSLGASRSMPMPEAPAASVPAVEKQEYLFAANNRPIAAADFSATAAPMQSKPTRSTVRSMRVTEARSAPSGTRAATVMPMQNAFRVTIVNDVITVLDADKSVYRGHLESEDQGVVAATSGARLTFNERYYEALHGASAPRAQVVTRFVLTGTNRTSNLPVQIAGRMMTQTQAVDTAAATTTSDSGNGTILQIQGTATINGAATFSIDASTQPR